jgi:hypothetical protein
MADVFLSNAKDRVRALALLSDVRGVRAYRGEALPERLRAYQPLRTGDIVVVTEPPRLFSSLSLAERLAVRARGLLGGRPGAHGFDPELADMGAILLALGRGVPVGERISPQRAVDVAPTVARLLGVDPPLQSEGKPIAEIGAEPGP